MTTRRRNNAVKRDQATINWEIGRALISQHPLFARLLSRVALYRSERVTGDRWT